MMRKLKIFVLLLLVLGVAILAFIGFANYSEGERAGMVIKLSRKGYAFKTWEGQLNLGMMLNEGGASVSNIWEFSVDRGNQTVIDQLNKAALDGKRASLHYREKYVRVFWRGDTKYFVDRVETRP